VACTVHYADSNRFLGTPWRIIFFFLAYKCITLRKTFSYLIMTAFILPPLIRFNNSKYSRVSVIRLSHVSCKSHSFVRPIDIVSFRILCMALYGRLFSLVRPSKFYVQIFESRLGRLTEIPLYLNTTFQLSASLKRPKENLLLSCIALEMIVSWCMKKGRPPLMVAASRMSNDLVQKCYTRIKLGTVLC